MSKAHRGKGIRELFARGRGTCPVCGATGIKALYEQESGDQKIKVCKPCRAAIKQGKKKIPAVAASVETETDEVAVEVKAAPVTAAPAAESSASTEASAPSVAE